VALKALVRGAHANAAAVAREVATEMVGAVVVVVVVVVVVEAGAVAVGDVAWR
jgi:hypothetical protein